MIHNDEVVGLIDSSARTTVADFGRSAVQAAGLAVDDLDAFIQHQAKNKITDAVAASLGLGSRTQTWS